MSSEPSIRQRTSTQGALTSGTESKDLLAGLKTIFDSSTCTRKGLCPVTKLRKQEDDITESHSLYFEQHGRGPEKVVFIMGLNSTSFSWAPQVEYFRKSDKYSLLVFDNRGVGNSDTPRGPYSTSGMAEDAICLLDYIGWTKERDMHVVGISLGGMIAQELATRIPERIISLFLAVTTPGGNLLTNLPPWKGTKSLIRLLLTTDPEQKLPLILDMAYPQNWLNLPSTTNPSPSSSDDTTSSSQIPSSSPSKTNREAQIPLYLHRIQHTRPQPPLGALSQMCAGLTHYVSAERLRKDIAEKVPKVLIVTGDEDNLVRPSNSLKLMAAMSGRTGKSRKELEGVVRDGKVDVELVVWEKTGHMLHMQWVERFNELLERCWEEGRRNLAERAAA